LPQKERDTIYKSILPDLDSSPRAIVKAENTKKNLSVIIEAKDATALRASFNTITRLLGVAKDAIE
jgi:tRNA threonylcarbamoyladenosine modification (KEOPS) complex  Pcc1 subunit